MKIVKTAMLMILALSVGVFGVSVIISLAGRDASAPVMILDEATSALDVATERRVLRQIIKKEPNRTVIVAAHRPSVFSMCSRVYKVGDHRIEEVDEAGIREFLDAF